MSPFLANEEWACCSLEIWFGFMSATLTGRALRETGDVNTELDRIRIQDISQ